MRSGYYYSVKRCVYSSLSTHTLTPHPYLLLYPLSGASRETHMLIFSSSKDTALGLAVPTGSRCFHHNRGFSAFLNTAL